MSNYSKVTDFTAKDALPAGNPDKKVRGQLFQDEFDAISTAVNTKAEEADIILPEQPVTPVIVAVDVPNASASINNFNTTEYRTITNNDTFRVVINPTSATSKLDVEYQLGVQFLSDQNRQTPIGVSVGFKYQIINNDTNNTAVFPDYDDQPTNSGITVRHLLSTQAAFGGADSNNYIYNLQQRQQVSLKASTDVSIQSLVGVSSSGYTIQLLGLRLFVAGGAARIEGSLTKVVEEVLL